MQENRYDGNDVLTDKVNEDQIKRALRDARNKVVAVHNAGSVITHSDGRQYVVQADGSWVRVRPSEEEHRGES